MSDFGFCIVGVPFKEEDLVDVTFREGACPLGHGAIKGGGLYCSRCGVRGRDAHRRVWKPQAVTLASYLKLCISDEEDMHDGSWFEAFYDYQALHPEGRYLGIKVPKQASLTMIQEAFDQAKVMSRLVFNGGSPKPRLFWGG